MWLHCALQEQILISSQESFQIKEWEKPQINLSCTRYLISTDDNITMLNFLSNHGVFSVIDSKKVSARFAGTFHL